MVIIFSFLITLPKKGLFLLEKNTLNYFPYVKFRTIFFEFRLFLLNFGSKINTLSIVILLHAFSLLSNKHHLSDRLRLHRSAISLQLSLKFRTLKILLRDNRPIQENQLYKHRVAFVGLQ